MDSNAANLLKLILDKCRGAAVTEMRFLSGMCPVFVDADGPHLVQVRDLSRDLVAELHALCLSMADEKVSERAGSATYSFAMGGLGRFRCTYESRGNAASLVLAPDSDAAETIAATRPSRPPSLGSEARREEDGL